MSAVRMKPTALHRMIVHHFSLETWEVSGTKLTLWRKIEGMHDTQREKITISRGERVWHFTDFIHVIEHLIVNQLEQSLRRALEGDSCQSSSLWGNQSCPSLNRQPVMQTSTCCSSLGAVLKGKHNLLKHTELSRTGPLHRFWTNPICAFSLP